MINFFWCPVGRRDFGDLLSADGLERLPINMAQDLAQFFRIGPSREPTLTALWSFNPAKSGQLPELLICPDGEDTDWAAWLTTFGAKLRPFSSHMRLVTSSMFQRLATTQRQPEFGKLTWPIVGLVLGEMLVSYNVRDRGLEGLPAMLGASCLSFAVFRAAALYNEFQETSAVVSMWEGTHRALKQRTRSPAAVTARVCTGVLNAIQTPTLTHGSQVDFEIQSACVELIASPQRAPKILTTVPDFSAVEERMHGPREDRVVALDAFLRAIPAVPPDRGELVAMALGYLASRIAPGTLIHANLLNAWLERFPSAMLWYGFCAGLGDVSSGRSASVDFPPIARRIARDLLRPERLVGRPTTDMSALELTVLARTGDPIAGLVTTGQGSLTIELLPGVWTAIGTRVTATEDVPRSSRERAVLSRMGEYIERLREAYSEIAGGRSADSESGRGSGEGDAAAGRQAGLPFKRRGRK